MNKEIKIRWIEALRSGKYKQHTQQLRYKDNYCCLGVLLDVTKNETNGFWSANGLFNYKNNNYAACISYPLITDIELDDKLQCKLIEMNDSEGKTFNQIADFLEKTIGETGETDETVS